jgi:hypothetical protein
MCSAAPRIRINFSPTWIRNKWVWVKIR